MAESKTGCGTIAIGVCAGLVLFCLLPFIIPAALVIIGGTAAVLNDATDKPSARQPVDQRDLEASSDTIGVARLKEAARISDRDFVAGTTFFVIEDAGETLVCEFRGELFRVPKSSTDWPTGKERSP